MSNLFVDTGAEFSEDKKHRYCLWRIWDKSKPLVMFIGLNPSTANASEDDPTIKSITRICIHNRYGGFYMMNLFTYITPYPKDLKRDHRDDLNNVKLLEAAYKNCEAVVFAWGSFDVMGMDKRVIPLFKEALCLGFNKNGSPKHPLYIKSKTQFSNFK